MKKQFKDIYKKCNRKIVIHDTYVFDDKSILDILNENDFLFFDDCLYSQYIFFKRNIQNLLKKKIICIFGFSSGIFRLENNSPIIEANCAIYHDKIHSGDKSAFNAYMSLNEIKEILTYDNAYLAGHGNMHLQLEKFNTTKLQKSKIFLNDLTQMIRKYNEYDFKTDIFVFPYAYDNILLAYTYLKIKRFNFLFAGKNTLRLSIEEILKK